MVELEFWDEQGRVTLARVPARDLATAPTAGDVIYIPDGDQSGVYLHIRVNSRQLAAVLLQPGGGARHHPSPLRYPLNPARAAGRPRRGTPRAGSLPARRPVVVVASSPGRGPPGPIRRPPQTPSTPTFAAPQRAPRSFPAPAPPRPDHPPESTSPRILRCCERTTRPASRPAAGRVGVAAYGRGQLGETLVQNGLDENDFGYRPATTDWTAQPRFPRAIAARRLLAVKSRSTPLPLGSGGRRRSLPVKIAASTADYSLT